jgi:hypothetical protein
MRFISILALIALALSCGGCASVTRGWTDQMQITSNPTEAQARTSLGQTCTTPCTLQVNRKDEFTVVISKPGYHSAEIPVTTRVAGAGAVGFAGNVLLGGVVGMGVDAVSGATLEHYPNPVAATLPPLKKGETPSVIRIAPPPPPAPRPDEGPPQS